VSIAVTRVPLRTVSAAIAAALSLVLLPGCRLGSILGGGDFVVRSAGPDPAQMTVDARTSLFAFRDPDSLTLLISDIPLSDLQSGQISTGQVICLTLLWNPQAGSTPIDSNATNCTVRQVVFTPDGVGLYGGAGFLYPGGDTTENHITGTMDDSTMRLVESSPGFADLLGTARVTGGIAVERDDSGVRDVMIQVNSEVSRRLGRVYFALGD